MTVFVDQIRDHGWHLGPSCHLLPHYANRYSSIVEMHDFAKKIGMHHTWFQDPGRNPHYDLTTGRRKKALLHGAVEIDTKGYLKMQRLLKKGSFIEPGCGLKMTFGFWYCLSDSGSFYDSSGYSTPILAKEKVLAMPEYELEPRNVSWCSLDLKTRDLGMVNLCNVVLAEDLLAFWALNDHTFLTGY